MRRPIYWKLTLSFMLVAFITAGLVALFVRITSADRLMQLIVDQQRSSVQQVLGEYYAEHTSWSGIAGQWQQLMRSLPEPNGPPNNAPRPDGFAAGRGGRPNFIGLADQQGRVIVAVDPAYPAGSQLPPAGLKAGTPVTVNGRQVGTILVARQPPGFNPAESQFLARTNEALVLAMVGALCIALLLGVFLAGTIARPLQALTAAAQSMEQGQLKQEVRVNSSDEIGELAAAFNRMSQELARVNQLRRQMTADIAHDLRTPLTVIAGYVESMRDGVLQPTPARLSLIYAEIERLQNLVGDLRMLSQADAGELPLSLQRLAPITLLDRAATLFRHEAERQSVALVVQADEDLPDVMVDEARMIQVLGNLLSNALRYTPAGGQIVLGAHAAGDRVELTVQDSGAGIAADQLPYIFDRFYRADKSRNTETGETGLGLAIVKALVESHHGGVRAESTPGAGTCIHVELPACGPLP